MKRTNKRSVIASTLSNKQKRKNEQNKLIRTLSFMFLWCQTKRKTVEKNLFFSVDHGTLPRLFENFVSTLMAFQFWVVWQYHFTPSKAKCWIKEVEESLFGKLFLCSQQRKEILKMPKCQQQILLRHFLFKCWNLLKWNRKQMWQAESSL